MMLYIIIIVIIIIIIWYDTMWYHIIGMYTKIPYIYIHIISIYFESFIFSAFCNYEADCSWNKHTQNILNRSFQSKHATCHLNGAWNKTWLQELVSRPVDVWILHCCVPSSRSCPHVHAKMSWKIPGDFCSMVRHLALDWHRWYRTTRYRKRDALNSCPVAWRAWTRLTQ